MPIADLVDSDSDPLLFLGAFLGIGGFVLLRAAYPGLGLDLLTLGSLVVLAIAYLTTTLLAASFDDKSDGDLELESTETERLLLESLVERDSELVDDLSARHPGVRQVVEDLIELWAAGESLDEVAFGSLSDPGEVEELIEEDARDV